MPLAPCIKASANKYAIGVFAFETLHIVRTWDELSLLQSTVFENAQLQSTEKGIAVVEFLYFSS